MRPTDIVLQVQEGRCHLGVTGMDVYAEHAFEAQDAAVVVPDLGYGGCRLVVAVPESWVDVGHVMDLVDLTAEFKASGKTFRVSTKYPALVRQYFRKWGVFHYQLINSDGALELHPSLGIADVIVDLTSSGVTLKDNRLREIGGGIVLDSASCLIGHAPSLRELVAEGHGGPLHLEVVGQGADSRNQAAKVAEYLSGQGAQHIARGEVWDEAGRPGWRVTALVAAKKLTACQRSLFDLGAIRIAGLPAQFVFDRDAPSTFDDLKARLAGAPIA